MSQDGHSVLKRFAQASSPENEKKTEKKIIENQTNTQKIIYRTVSIFFFFLFTGYACLRITPVSSFVKLKLNK